MQYTLTGKKLTRREQLITKRQYLYDDMVNKLKQLQKRKIEMIQTYNAKAKDIDKELYKLKV